MKQNEKYRPERRSTLQNFGHTPNNRKIPGNLLRTWNETLWTMIREVETIEAQRNSVFPPEIS